MKKKLTKTNQILIQNWIKKYIKIIAICVLQFITASLYANSILITPKCPPGAEYIIDVTLDSSYFTAKNCVSQVFMVVYNIDGTVLAYPQYNCEGYWSFICGSNQYVNGYHAIFNFTAPRTDYYKIEIRGMYDCYWKNAGPGLPTCINCDPNITESILLTKKTYFFTDYGPPTTPVAATPSNTPTYVPTFTQTPTAASIRVNVTENLLTVGPAAGVQVILSGAMDSSGTTDPTGKLLFTDLPTGDYTLSLTKDCFVPAVRQLHLNIEEKIENFSLLAMATTISGVVLDVRGLPISGALVMYIPNGGIYGPFSISDEHGIYSITVKGNAVGQVIATKFDSDMQYRGEQKSISPQCGQNMTYHFRLRKELNIENNEEDEKLEADPVSPFTGKISNSITDFKLMGKHGYDLYFKRFYRGELWQTESMFGKGWTSNFNSFINTQGKYILDTNGQIQSYEDINALPAFLHYEVSVGQEININKKDENKTYKYKVLTVGSSIYYLYEIADNLDAQSKISVVYDNLGRISVVTDTLNRVLIFEYDPVRTQFLSKIWQDGMQLIEYKYNKNEQNDDYILSLINSKNLPYLNCSYKYDVISRLVEKTESNAPVGNYKVKYGYDNYNRVSSVTSLEEDLRFVYEENKPGIGYTTSCRIDGTSDPKDDYIRDVNQEAYRTIITDLKKNTTKIHYYGGAGSLIRETVDGQNNYIVVDTVTLKPLQITDNKGRTSYYKYDSNQNLTWVNKPAALSYGSTKTDCITVYTYDQNNKVSSVIDPEGGQITYTRDNYGNILTEFKNAGTGNSFENHEIINNYANVDNWTEATKLNYGQTRLKECSWIYTNTDSIIYREVIGGQTFEIAYDKFGRVKSKDSALGKTYFNYNDNVITTLNTDGPGTNDSIVYYALGNKKLREIDANENETSYGYDESGRMISKRINITKPSTESLRTTYTYYSDGKLKSITDGNTSINYTYEKDKIKTITNDGLTITYNYSYTNGIEEKNEIGPGGSNNTTNFINEQGNTIKILNTDGKSIHYSYDRNGNLVSATDQRNNTVNYIIDKLNRIKQITYSGGVQDNFSYDGRNNVISSYGYFNTYDVFDRLDNIRQTANGNIVQDLNYCTCGALSSETMLNDLNSIISYQYSPEGWLLNTNYPDGTVVSNTYDKVGNILTIKLDGNIISSYKYDEANRMYKVNENIDISRNLSGAMTSINYPNGTKMNYTYGKAHMIKNAVGINNSTNSILTKFEIPDSGGRDDAQNIKIKNTMVGQTTYIYDSANQLKQFNSVGENKEITYNYDFVGNRINVVNESGTDLYSAKQNNNEYETIKGENVTNSNGCMTSYLGKILTWDYRNRLSSVTVDNKFIDYKYKFDNLRIEKRINGNVDTKYYYDGNKLIAEKDVSGNIKKIYINDNEGIVGFARKVNMTQQYQYFYYLFDNQGSVAAITNDIGQPVQYYSYDPFGNITNMEVDNLNNLTFIGKYGGFKDWDTGLIYFWNRWYDPEIGRWTSRDPIGVTNGVEFNFYQYSLNNPVNRIDTNGLCSKENYSICYNKYIDCMLGIFPEMFTNFTSLLSHNTFEIDAYQDYTKIESITLAITALGLYLSQFEGYIVAGILDVGAMGTILSYTGGVGLSAWSGYNIGKCMNIIIYCK